MNAAAEKKECATNIQLDNTRDDTRHYASKNTRAERRHPPFQFVTGFLCV